MILKLTGSDAPAPGQPPSAASEAAVANPQSLNTTQEHINSLFESAAASSKKDAGAEAKPSPTTSQENVLQQLSNVIEAMADENEAEEQGQQTESDSSQEVMVTRSQGRLKRQLSQVDADETSMDKAATKHQCLEGKITPAFGKTAAEANAQLLSS